MKKYHIIYADPPWSFTNKQAVSTPGYRKNVHISERYPVLKTKDIKKLNVQIICKSDSVLFIWTTNTHLKQAIEVMNAWGFKFITIAFVWRKITNTGKCRVNMGMWTMPSIEICLLGTKGKPHKLLISRKIRQFIQVERRQHSQKPDEARDRISEMFGNIPKIELFSREKHKGWDVWGNEVESKISLKVKD